MTKANETTDMRLMGGAYASNALVNPKEYHDQFNNARTVPWTTKGLRITRLSLLSDPGYPFWDVSYCHGELHGELVRVALPFSDLPKRAVSKTIIEYAVRAGVYAKGTGIFEAISTLC